MNDPETIMKPPMSGLPLGCPRWTPEVGEQARQARGGRRGGVAGWVPGGAGDDDGPARLGDVDPSRMAF